MAYLRGWSAFKLCSHSTGPLSFSHCFCHTHKAICSVDLLWMVYLWNLLFVCFYSFLFKLNHLNIYFQHNRVGYIADFSQLFFRCFIQTNLSRIFTLCWPLPSICMLSCIIIFVLLLTHPSPSFSSKLFYPHSPLQL